MSRGGAEYEFNYGEGGHVLEVYLPKRIAYQGALYGALQLALNDRRAVKLKRYLRENKARNRRFLPREIWESYDAHLADFVNYLAGYSMYEVDGAFYHPAAGVEEERTQVLRLIGQPRLEPLLTGKSDARRGALRLLAKEFLSSRLYAEEFVAQKGSPPHLLRDERALIAALDKYLVAWAMLLYGYLVPQVAEVAREREIWVTSYYVVTNVFSARSS